jgi:hypothetical protein
MQNARGLAGMNVVKRPHESPRLPIIYNAFLSYSHSADAELARALQRALHRLAKRPFQLRALRVLRDTASLAANPALWPAIQDALQASEYLILVASPEAAASVWVEKEVNYWRQVKLASHVLLALTAGEIVCGTRSGAISIGPEPPRFRACWARCSMRNRSGWIFAGRTMRPIFLLIRASVIVWRTWQRLCTEVFLSE